MTGSTGEAGHPGGAPAQSNQYVLYPVLVFRDVHRVLRPGARELTGEPG